MTRDHVWKILLVLAAAAAIAFAVHAVVTVSRAGKPFQPAPKVPMMCASCGHETISKVGAMPMKCPACKKQTLELAAYCRADKTTLPLLDSAAYLASPQAAMGRAKEILPQCPECGKIMPPKLVVEPDADPP